MLALGLLTGCGQPLSADECDSLLDHYTKKLVLEEHPKTEAQEVHRKQEEARELAHRDPVYEFEQCPKKVSRRQFRCAMSAETVNSIEQCLVL